MDDRLTLPGRNNPNLVFDILAVIEGDRRSCALHVVHAKLDLFENTFDLIGQRLNNFLQSLEFLVNLRYQDKRSGLVVSVRDDLLLLHLVARLGPLIQTSLFELNLLRSGELGQVTSTPQDLLVTK